MSPITTRRLLIAALSSLIVLLAAPAPTSAQNNLSVTINQLTAVPVEGQAAYTVTAYTTVSQDTDQPLADLPGTAFGAAQDGAPVTLSSTALTKRPASIILVIDTSGSMAYESKMTAARDAATSFINGLSADDQVGIIYFNDQVTVAQKPSPDQQAARSIVSLIGATPDGGTCMYDAAYTGIQLATATPVGQRAVVLLTDGMDSMPGGNTTCSTHTAADVITLANQEGINVPVYTVGVGQSVDKDDLRHMADQTGGVSLIAPAASDLTALFTTLAAQIKTQYALVYQTETTSGEHTLTITVNTGGASGVGTRKFIAPELPPTFNLSGMDAGAILKGQQTLRATLSGKGDVSKVTFTLDNTVLAEDAQAPYEVTLDSAPLAAGSHHLAANATLTDGAQLKASLDFAVAAPEPASGQPAAQAASSPFSGPLPIAIGAGVIVLAAVVLMRRRNTSSSAPTTHRSLSGDAFGMLTVQQSISLQKGHIFELSGNVVRIGRGEDNDVVVPDAPVSRNHAEIRREKGALMVLDLQTTYGTSVNNKKIEEGGAPLKNGDRLKLGTRTVLTFTAILQPEARMSDRTLDNIAETILGVDTSATIAAEDLVPSARPTTPDKVMPDGLQGGLSEHDQNTEQHD